MRTYKIPWSDLYIVKGSALREDENKKMVHNKIMVNIVEENHILRQRLAKANVGLVPRKRRPGSTVIDKLLKKESG